MPTYNQQVQRLIPGARGGVTASRQAQLNAIQANPNDPMAWSDPIYRAYNDPRATATPQSRTVTVGGGTPATSQTMLDYYSSYRPPGHNVGREPNPLHRGPGAGPSVGVPAGSVPRPTTGVIHGQEPWRRMPPAQPGAFRGGVRVPDYGPGATSGKLAGGTFGQPTPQPGGFGGGMQGMGGTGGVPNVFDPNLTDISGSLAASEFNAAGNLPHALKEVSRRGQMTDAGSLSAALPAVSRGIVGGDEARSRIYMDDTLDNIRNQLDYANLDQKTRTALGNLAARLMEGEVGFEDRILGDVFGMLGGVLG